MGTHLKHGHANQALIRVQPSGNHGKMAQFSGCRGGVATWDGDTGVEALPRARL